MSTRASLFQDVMMGRIQPVSIWLTREKRIELHTADGTVQAIPGVAVGRRESCGLSEREWQNAVDMLISIATACGWADDYDLAIEYIRTFPVDTSGAVQIYPI